MPTLSVTVLLTGLDLLGLMAAGGAVNALICLLPQARTDAWVQTARAWLWRVLMLAWAELSLITPLLLIDRTINLSHEPWPAADMLWPVITQTHYGDIWLLRLLALLLGWLMLAFRARLDRLADRIMFLVLLVMIVYRSASGHAADMGDWSTLEFADGLHQWFAMSWGGTLLAIMPVLWQLNRRLQPATGEIYADFALRLSRLAALGLFGVLLTGIYMAWHQLGQLNLLWTTPYGQILSLKLSLVALMALLGASNRFWHVPRLLENSGLGQSGWIWPHLPAAWRQALQTPLAHAWQGLIRTASWEAMLMVVILIIVSLLINTMPHMHMHM